MILPQAGKIYIAIPTSLYQVLFKIENPMQNITSTDTIRPTLTYHANENKVLYDSTRVN